MIKTLTLEELDRTIYELLRVKLVSLGYLPDITQMADEFQYRIEKSLIKDRGVEVIEVVGVGAAESRDEKSVCEIIIDRKSTSVGVLGGFPSHQYIKKSNGRFEKQRIPDMTSTVEYEIRTICNTVKYERIMGNIIRSVFGMRKYLNVIEDYNEEGDKKFLMIGAGDKDVSSTDLRERLFSYSIVDVWLGEPELMADDIPPLTSVIFTLSLRSNNNEDVKVIEKEIKKVE